MGSGPLLEILYTIPTLLAIVFYAAVLLVLATFPSDGSKAKLYAISGTTILLFESVAGWAAHFVASRFLDPSVLGVAFGVLSIMQSLLYFVGLSFVLLAVVTGRKPAVANDSTDSAGGSRTPQAGDNPYASPASR